MRHSFYSFFMKFFMILLGPAAIVAVEIGNILLLKYPAMPPAGTYDGYNLGVYLFFYGMIGSIFYIALVSRLIVWHYWQNNSPMEFIKAVEKHAGVDNVLQNEARAFKLASDKNDQHEMERIKNSFKKMSRWMETKGFIVKNFSSFLSRV